MGQIILDLCLQPNLISFDIFGCGAEFGCATNFPRKLFSDFYISQSFHKKPSTEMGRLQFYFLLLFLPLSFLLKCLDA